MTIVKTVAIAPGASLYSGTLHDLTAEPRRRLAAMRIRHVVTVSPERRPQVTARVRGVAYCHVPLSDTPDADLRAALRLCEGFIRDALVRRRANVLVQCPDGLATSMALTAAYMVRHLGFETADHALAYLAFHNPFSPLRVNRGFVRRLHALARETHGPATRRRATQTERSELARDAGEAAHKAPVPEQQQQQQQGHPKESSA